MREFWERLEIWEMREGLKHLRNVATHAQIYKNMKLSFLRIVFEFLFFVQQKTDK